jgi:hypothetical protein
MWIHYYIMERSRNNIYRFNNYSNENNVMCSANPKNPKNPKNLKIILGLIYLSLSYYIFYKLIIYDSKPKLK